MLITLERVLDAATVHAMRQALLAPDAPWQDGARSAGALARAVKHNQQLDDASPLAARLRAQVLAALAAQPLFTSAALPRRIHPPKFNRYAGGGRYGAHVDGAVMRWPQPDASAAAAGDAGWMRTDLSATLFLAEPEDYDGGELEVETPFGVQAVKLAAGDMVLYPSTSLHRVTPVTRGARLASFLWIESLVRDEGERALLFDLDRAIQALSPGRSADDAQLLTLSGVYHNLLRRWAVS